MVLVKFFDVVWLGCALEYVGMVWLDCVLGYNEWWNM